MHRWSPGYTRKQLVEAQERYGLQFPPDLLAFYLERQPTDGYDWSTENERIRWSLNWPLKMLLFGVKEGFWWPDWGTRPEDPAECIAIVTAALRAAPRLIPLSRHRFIPETPHETGNPVFSMFGFDTIYYGANLEDYFRHEFDRIPTTGPYRHIPFWSDFVERSDEAYALYAATGRPQVLLAAVRDALRKKYL